MVFFYIVTPWRSMVTRNVYIKVLKLAVLEHILYRISVTIRSSEYCTQRSSIIQLFRIKYWVFQLKKVSIVQSVQSPGSKVQHPDSSVQSPGSKVQCPEFIQGPASRVHGLESNVQSPASNTWVLSECVHLTKSHQYIFSISLKFGVCYITASSVWLVHKKMFLNVNSNNRVQKRFT